MTKHRMKLLLGLLCWLFVVQNVVDAAPRNRRRSRRTPRYTSTTNYPINGNTIRYTQTNSYSPASAYSPVVDRAPATTVSKHTVLRPIQAVAPKTSTNLAHSVEANPIVSSTVVGTNSTDLHGSVPTETSGPLDVGDSLPPDPDVKQDRNVVAATFTEAQPLAFPMVTSPARPPVLTASVSGSALAEVNMLRAQRGLAPFIEDASLSTVAYQKASIQANRGAMGHPGGSLGGARYEGVGMGSQFVSCYLYSNVGRYAGAASVVGRNGQRYHCLLIR